MAAISPKPAPAAAVRSALPVGVDVGVDELVGLVVEPLIRWAEVWNAVKLLGPFSTALIAITIPFPQ